MFYKQLIAKTPLDPRPHMANAPAVCRAPGCIIEVEPSSKACRHHLYLIGVVELIKYGEKKRVIERKMYLRNIRAYQQLDLLIPIIMFHGKFLNNIVTSALTFSWYANYRGFRYRGTECILTPAVCLNTLSQLCDKHSADKECILQSNVQ